MGRRHVGTLVGVSRPYGGIHHLPHAHTLARVALVNTPGRRWFLGGAAILAVLWAVATAGLTATAVRAQAAAPTWSQAETLTDLAQNAALPAAAVDRMGLVHMVWAGNAPGEEQLRGTERLIYYSVWDGKAWSTPQDVIISPGVILAMALCADSSGSLHLMWESGSQLLYARRVRSSDGEAGWTDPLPLDEVGIIPGQFSVDIAADAGGKLHVALAEEARRILYLSSEDEGETWEQQLVFENEDHQVAEPQLLVDHQQRLHIVWASYAAGGWPPRGIFYSRSEDGGQTWEVPAPLSPEEPFAKPSITEREPNEIHVVWSGTSGDAGDRRGRYHDWSLDGGHSWSGMSPISGLPFTLGSTLHGLIADAAGRLVLVSGIDEVMAAVWSGQSWSAPARLSGPLAEDTECGSVDAVAVLGNRIMAYYHCSQPVTSAGSIGSIWVNWLTTDAPPAEALPYAVDARPGSAAAGATPPPAAAVGQVPVASATATVRSPQPPPGSRGVLEPVDTSALSLPVIAGALLAGLVVFGAIVVHRSSAR